MVGAALVAVLAFAMVPATVQAETSDSVPESKLGGTLGLHTYLNLGETWSADPDSPRVDAARFLAILPIGLDLYAGDHWRLGLSGESLVGMIVPSLLLEGTVEFAPWGAKSSGPVVRAGARWMYVSIGIVCARGGEDCRQKRRELDEWRETAPADAFGTAIRGGLGELGLGYQFGFDGAALYGMVAYQGGYLEPTPGSRSLPVGNLAGYYQGYLVTLGVHIH